MLKSIFGVSFCSIHKTLSTGTLEDVQELVGKTTDRNALINYISVMKKYVLFIYLDLDISTHLSLNFRIMIKKMEKIDNLQDQLLMHRDSVTEERSKNMFVFSILKQLNLYYDL